MVLLHSEADHPDVVASFAVVEVAVVLGLDVEHHQEEVPDGFG